MKFIYQAFFFLSFVSVTLSIPRYRCSDDLKISTCYAETEEYGRTVVYINSCGIGGACGAIKKSHMNQCITPKNERRDEGKSCKIDKECKSLHCVNEKCKYKTAGETVETEEECAPDLRVKDSKCVEMIKEGEACNSSNECEIGLVCNEGDSTSTCVTAFSLENGSAAKNPMACKSGQLYKSSSDSYCAALTNPTLDTSSGKNVCKYEYDAGTKGKGTYELSEPNVEPYLQGLEEGSVACRTLNGKKWNEYIKTYNDHLKEAKENKFGRNFEDDEGEEDNLFEIAGRYHYGISSTYKAFANWKFQELLDTTNACVKKALKQLSGSNLVFSTVTLGVLMGLIL